jgi:hypothetical protein
VGVVFALFSVLANALCEVVLLYTQPSMQLFDIFSEVHNFLPQGLSPF